MVLIIICPSKIPVINCVCYSTADLLALLYIKYSVDWRSP